MDADVPYVLSVTNLPRILDAIQRAGVPEVFNRDFLTDLGFTSSQDRPMVKVLKYLGFLDGSGRPQTPYRDFVDHTKSKKVLAERMRRAFDDLFLSDRQANAKSVESLKGWFKSKTGAGDAVAQKMASTFKALAQYADWSEPAPAEVSPEVLAPESDEVAEVEQLPRVARPTGRPAAVSTDLGFVYRIEIHLPDTQNVETFRSIFRALREELMA